MAMHVEVKNALAVVAVGAIVYQVMKFLWNAVWEPLRLRRIMEKQGLRGPPFRFLVGSLKEANAFSESCPESLPLDNYANLSPTVTPHYALYFPKYGTVCELLVISGGQSYVTLILLKEGYLHVIEALRNVFPAFCRCRLHVSKYYRCISHLQYLYAMCTGKNFVYHWGTTTRLAVGDPDVVKELLITNHESLIRAPLDEKIVSELLGKGLLSQLGEKWIKERRTLNPFFHQDALKVRYITKSVWLLCKILEILDYTILANDRSAYIPLKVKYSTYPPPHCRAWWRIWWKQLQQRYTSGRRQLRNKGARRKSTWKSICTRFLVGSFPGRLLVMTF